jgi:hypothetical protein
MKIRPMFGASRKPKQFDYTPRYYKPQKNTGHREIEFQRLTSRGQGKSIMLYAAILFGVLYLISYIATRFNV